MSNPTAPDFWQHLVQWQPATAAALAQYLRTLPDDWPLRVFGVGRPDAALTLPPGAAGERFPDRAPEVAPYDEIAEWDDCPACTETAGNCRFHEGYAAGYHQQAEALRDAVKARPDITLREFFLWQADVADAEDRGEEPPMMPAVSSAGQAPATDQTDDDVRDQVLHALDFAYCQGIGYSTPEELLAAYDASRAPAVNQTALRDRIRRAVCEAEGFMWNEELLEPDEYGEVADAVLAVLPAPAVQAEAVLRVVETALGDTLVDSARDEALAGIAGVLHAAPTDQTAVLTASERQFLRFALDLAFDRMVSDDGFTDEDEAALKRLRRMADETPAAETTADKAARYGMTPEEYRAHRHLAAVRQIRAALPGLYAKTGLRVEAALAEPAAGARQDEPRPSTPPCVHCTHPKSDHDGRADHRAKYSPLMSGEPWCHACNASCDYAETQPPAVTLHAIPLPGSNGISACCGRPPCEFVGERVTRDPDKVTCTGPAAGARQDGADHVCNSVWARGEMDEPLGYLICGMCGKPKGEAKP